MVETSFYWEGTAAGDATLAPYSPDRYHTLWQIMFTRDDNEGIINGYLNSLEVLGITGGIKVLSGAALVDGLFYENDDSKSVEMTEPVTDPRIDLVVIRKDWGTQEARIATIEGVENASPTAPTVTQTAGAIWEIPLAQALITTSGTITITDVRELPIGRIFPTAGLVHIKTITSDGTLSQFDFQDISQIYRHLHIECQLRHNRTFDNIDLGLMRFNGDAGNNYSVQILVGGNITVAAVAIIAFSGANIRGIATNASAAGQASQHTIYIPNYTNNLYKSFFVNQFITPENIVGNFDLNMAGGTWLNTSAVERISIFNFDDPTGSFVPGSTVSLYGVP